MLWGADLLAVHHLTPPRRFTIGDGDLALAREALGTDTLPLVLVDPAGVSVIAPRGAIGTIEDGKGTSIPLETAVAHARAEPWPALPSAVKIRLDPGCRVTIAIPSAAGEEGYRGASATVTGEERVVFEITLGRADEAPPRQWLAPDGRLRSAGSIVAAAAVLLGALRVGAMFTPPPWDDEEGPSVDQRYAMMLALQAVDERLAAEAELDAPSTGPRSHFVGPRPSHWRMGALEFYPWELEAQLPPEILREPFDAELHAFLSLCNAHHPLTAWQSGTPRRFSDPLEWVCGTAVVTPFGLRGITPTRPPRPWPDESPSDLWELSYQRARTTRRLGLGLGGAPRVAERHPTSEVRARRVSEVATALPSLDRLVQTRRHALRACYDLGRIYQPILTGTLELRLLVGADGEVRAYVSEMDLVDTEVAHCAAGTLDRARIFPPPSKVTTATYQITFELRKGH